jgi:hypothetical protein
MIVGCRPFTSASVQLGDAADDAWRGGSVAADRAVEREALAGLPAVVVWATARLRRTNGPRLNGPPALRPQRWHRRSAGSCRRPTPRRGFASAVCSAVTPRAWLPGRGTRRAGRGDGHGSTAFDDRSTALDDSSPAGGDRS